MKKWIEQTYLSKLALFQKPYIESSIEEVQYIDFPPTSTISDGSVIKFRILGTSTEYIDLKRSRLKLKAKIVKSDDTPIGQDSNVGLVNLSLASLFQQVDVQMQDKLVSSEINICYPYKAMMDVLLRCGFDMKEGPLQSELCYKYTGNMDAVPPGNNSGLMSRVAYTANGNEVTLEGPVQITSAILRVCHVKVSNVVILAQNEALNVSPALYPFWKSNFKTISVPAGVSAMTSDDTAVFPVNSSWPWCTQRHLLEITH